MRLIALLAGFGFASLCLALADSAVPVVSAGQIDGLLKGSSPVAFSTLPPATGPRDSRYEDEMARIGGMQAMPIDAKDTPLRAIIAMLCNGMKMNYSLSTDALMSQLVTKSVNQHPWVTLQNLAEQYRLQVSWKRGEWIIGPRNDDELILRHYVLKHNALERFSSSSGGGGSGLGGGSTTGQSTSQGGTQQNGQSQGGAQSISSGNSNPSRIGQGIYALDSSAIETRVKEFLGLETTGMHALINSGADLGAPAVEAQRDSTSGKNSTRPDSTGQTPAASGMVQYISDVKTLSVYTTRQKHELLESWLAVLDRPRKQVYLEVRFYSTSDNPSSKIGVGSPLSSPNGYGVHMTDLSNDGSTALGAVNPFNPHTWQLKTSKLAADDIDVSLQANVSASASKLIANPSVTTVSGQEAVLRAVKQVAIVSGSATQASGGSTTTNSINYVDAGVVCSMTPNVLNDDEIELNMALEVSSFDGSTVVNGNSYPRIDNQTFQNRFIVKNGYSLAIGGFEQSAKTSDLSKMPVLGDIPILGYAFKTSAKTNSHHVLTVVVTPVIQTDYAGGNFEGTARFNIPQTGPSYRKKFDGGPSATVYDVRDCLNGFRRELDEISRVVKDGRGDSSWLKKAGLLEAELCDMKATLDLSRARGAAAPTLEENVGEHLRRVRALIKQIPNTSPIS